MKSILIASALAGIVVTGMILIIRNRSVRSARKGSTLSAGKSLEEVREMKYSMG